MSGNGPPTCPTYDAFFIQSTYELHQNWSKIITAQGDAPGRPRCCYGRGVLSSTVRNSPIFANAILIHTSHSWKASELQIDIYIYYIYNIISVSRKSESDTDRMQTQPKTGWLSHASQAKQGHRKNNSQRFINGRFLSSSAIGCNTWVDSSQIWKASTSKGLWLDDGVRRNLLSCRLLTK